MRPCEWQGRNPMGSGYRSVERKRKWDKQYSNAKQGFWRVWTELNVNDTPKAIIQTESIQRARYVESWNER